MHDSDAIDDPELLAAIAAAFGPDAAAWLDEPVDEPPAECMSMSACAEATPPPPAASHQPPTTHLVLEPTEPRLARRRWAKDEARYVLFEQGGLAMAAPMGQVVEIQRAPEVTPLPQTPPWLVGAASLRGQILSIIDLGPLLGRPTLDNIPSRRLMVVRTPQGDQLAGLLTDRVLGVRGAREDRVRPAQQELPERLRDWQRGVVVWDDRPTVVVDMERLLRADLSRRMTSPAACPPSVDPSDPTATAYSTSETRP